MLKAPGIKRLTEKCDEVPSNLPFNFKLRRYSTGVLGPYLVIGPLSTLPNWVGLCRLTLSNPLGKRLDLTA